MSANLPKFSMVFTADSSDLTATTNEVRRDISSVSKEADKASNGLSSHASALDKDAAAAKRAAEANRLLAEEARRAREEMLKAQGAIPSPKTAPTPAPRNNPQPLPANNNGGTGRNFAATNAMFQFQDILMTAAGGMDSRMIGLQQGSQLAGGYAGMSLKEAAVTTGSALAGLVSPVSIAAIGITTLTAAAVQYGISAISSFNKSNEALEKHDSYLKEIRSTYKSAAEAGEQFGQRTQNAIAFSVNQDRRGLKEALNSGLRNFAYRATPSVDASQMLYADADISGLTAQMGRDAYGAFAESVARFADSARSGQGDVLAFNEEIKKIALADANNKHLQDKATDILAMASAATQAAEKLKELRQAELELTMETARSDAARTMLKYQADNDFAMLSMQRERTVSLSELSARSPQELAEAARARAALAPVDPKESPEVRNYRIEQAGVMSLAKAEKELADAREQRQRSLTARMESQRLENSLIGQTVAETERLRMAYQLTAEVKEEAARRGIEVDKAELEMIQRKAAEYGQQAERNVAAMALRTQGETIAKLQVEIATVGMSDEVRRRLLATLQAEQDIRQRGLNTASAEAEKYRENALAMSDMEAALKRQTDAWQQFRSAGENAIGSVVDSLSEGDLVGALKGVANAVNGYMADNIKRSLSNGLLGTNYGTVGDLGSVGSMFSQLTGSQTTAGMSVTSGTVSISFDHGEVE